MTPKEVVEVFGGEAQEIPSSEGAIKPKDWSRWKLEGTVSYWGFQGREDLERRYYNGYAPKGWLSLILPFWHGADIKGVKEEGLLFDAAFMFIRGKLSGVRLIEQRGQRVTEEDYWRLRGLYEMKYGKASGTEYNSSKMRAGWKWANSSLNIEWRKNDYRIHFDRSIVPFVRDKWTVDENDGTSKAAPRMAIWYMGMTREMVEESLKATREFSLTVTASGAR
jgi:hypothetical protein